MFLPIFYQSIYQYFICYRFFTDLTPVCLPTFYQSVYQFFSVTDLFANLFTTLTATYYHSVCQHFTNLFTILLSLTDLFPNLFSNLTPSYYQYACHHFANEYTDFIPISLSIQTKKHSTNAKQRVLVFPKLTPTIWCFILDLVKTYSQRETIPSTCKLLGWGLYLACTSAMWVPR